MPSRQLLAQPSRRRSEVADLLSLGDFRVHTNWNALNMMIGKLLNSLIPLLCSFLFAVAFLAIAISGARRTKKRGWRLLVWSATAGFVGCIVSTLLWSPVAIFGLKLQNAGWILVINLATFVSGLLLLAGLASLAFRDNQVA